MLKVMNEPCKSAIKSKEKILMKLTSKVWGL